MTSPSPILTPKIHFGFLFFASLFCLLTFVEPFDYSWFPKVIPIAILIYAAKPLLADKKQRFFVIGLIFSAGGDVILAIEQGRYFVFGLGSFLIAHLFYLAYLLPCRFHKSKIPLLLMYTMYGGAMMLILLPNLGELLIPVVLYMLVLMAMGIAAVISNKTNHWLIIGGISFVLSDSLIGFNKFVAAIPYSHLFIMVTYYFAQFALLTGALINNQQQAAEN